MKIRIILAFAILTLIIFGSEKNVDSWGGKFKLTAVAQETNHHVKMINGVMHVPYCHYIDIKTRDYTQNQRIYYRINKEPEREFFGRPLTIESPGYNILTLYKGKSEDRPMEKVKIYVDNIAPAVNLVTTCIKLVSYPSLEIEEQCDPMIRRPPMTVEPPPRIPPEIEEPELINEWDEDISMLSEIYDNNVPGADEEDFDDEDFDDEDESFDGYDYTEDEEFQDIYDVEDEDEFYIPAQSNKQEHKMVRLTGGVATDYLIEVDDASKKGHVEYKIDGGKWKNLGGGTFSFATYGIHILELKVTDGVGYQTYIKQPVSVDGVTIWFYKKDAAIPKKGDTMIPEVKKNN